MPQRLMNWRSFWTLWLGGIAIFIFLVVSNGRLVTPVSPGGILDHQGAGSAAAVDAIRAAWVAVGVNGFATLAMAIDLVFIGIYTLGGLIGAKLIAADVPNGGLRWLAALTFVAYLLFGLLDYAETIAQFIQQAGGRGNHTLATIAAAAKGPKTLVFGIAGLAMIAALIWHRIASAPRP